MGEFGDLIIAIHVGVIQGRAQCGSWFVNYAAATLPEARPGVLGTIALRYGNDLIDAREEICYDRRNTKLAFRLQSRHSPIQVQNMHSREDKR